VVADGVIDGDLAAGSGGGLLIAGEVEGVLIHGAHRVEVRAELTGKILRTAVLEDLDCQTFSIRCSHR
jgi:hypothetical protein